MNPKKSTPQECTEKSTRKVSIKKKAVNLVQGVNMSIK